MENRKIYYIGVSMEYRHAQLIVSAIEYARLFHPVDNPLLFPVNLLTINEVLRSDNFRKRKKRGNDVRVFPSVRFRRRDFWRVSDFRGTMNEFGEVGRLNSTGKI